MTRVASGAALIALVVGAIWFLPPLALLILAEVVLLLAFLEYASLTDKLGMRIPRLASTSDSATRCIRPAPISTSVPTMFRTIWRRKPSAVTS